VQKVTICHRTGKKKKPYVRIRVAKSALAPHLRHGDILPGSGPCPTTLKRTDKKGHVLGAAKQRHGARPSRIGFAG
jgi:hypothetical protein